MWTNLWTLLKNNSPPPPSTVHMVYWCPQKVIKKLFRCALKMIEAFFSRLLFFKPLSLIVLYNLISVSKLRIVFSSKCPSRKRQITSAMHFCKNCPQEINKFCKLNSKVKYTKTLNPNKGWIPERNNDIQMFSISYTDVWIWLWDHLGTFRKNFGV